MDSGGSRVLGAPSKSNAAVSKAEIGAALERAKNDSEGGEVTADRRGL